VKRGSTAGVTLVELLVAVALIVFVSTLVLMSFQTAMKARQVAMDRTDTYEKARFALDLIAQDLRTAYLSAQSVSDEHEAWNEDNPLTRFVGLNRSFTFGDPPSNDAQNERAKTGQPHVLRYARDLISFAAVQDNPGDLSDIVHIAYTAKKNLDMPGAEGIKRMTLMRGYDYTDYNEDGDIERPGFRTPTWDTDDPYLNWTPVCENIWGIDFQFFTYDYSLSDDGYGGWSSPSPETSYVELRWGGGMPEWHSAGESGCYAALLDLAEGTDDSIWEKYSFSSFEDRNTETRRLPILANPATMSYYPMCLYYMADFDTWPTLDTGRYYYDEDSAFFLANEENDASFATHWKSYDPLNTGVYPPQEEFDKMIDVRDGLPRLVQITLWVQPGNDPRVRVYPDGQEYVDDRFLPVMLQTRVSLSIK